MDGVCPFVPPSGGAFLLILWVWFQSGKDWSKGPIDRLLPLPYRGIKPADGTDIWGDDGYIYTSPPKFWKVYSEPWGLEARGAVLAYHRCHTGALNPLGGQGSGRFIPNLEGLEARGAMLAYHRCPTGALNPLGGQGSGRFILNLGGLEARGVVLAYHRCPTGALNPLGGGARGAMLAYHRVIQGH
jgi:hypothetical protein